MQGITVIPYPDDLLLKAPSPVQLHQNVFETCPFLLQHGWMLNFQKSQLVLSQRLLFLGFRIPPNRRFFLPEDKIKSLQLLVCRVLGTRRVSVHLCIPSARKNGRLFRGTQFGRFHSLTFQLNRLTMVRFTPADESPGQTFS